jgi:glycosyltransferase involved in cell wall biosynthesis
MKIPLTGKTGTENDAIPVQPPVKVCMHVWGTARTDGRVIREATALAEAGFSVSIVDVERERSRSLTEEFRGLHLKHIVWPNWFVSTRFKPWFLVKAMRLLIYGTLRLLQTPADVYHAHDENALPACYIVARLRHKPLIFDAHELPLSETHITRWRRLHALATTFLARMVPSCVGIITVSPPIAKELHSRYRGPEATLIRNVLAYRSVAQNDRLRQRLGLGPQVRLALYQGNLQADRGLDRLIRAASLLDSNNVIVIMGEASEAILSELGALIANEKVADRVKIIPPVPYEELLDWTASADIGLIIYSPDRSLNVRMCLPNKLFEYLMAGLPVLVSQLDAVVEIVETYDVGRIVSSLAPADIAAAINRMLADTVALTHLRRNALNVAHQELCWEKESNQLIRLYCSVLNGEVHVEHYRGQSSNSNSPTHLH